MRIRVRKAPRIIIGRKNVVRRGEKSLNFFLGFVVVVVFVTALVVGDGNGNGGVALIN